MSTKERILRVALDQFNKMGTDQATVRSIADEVGISHGNLCYHFKNTDALIEALYDQLVSLINEQVQSMQLPDNKLELLYEQASASFQLLYQYRFLLLDFVRIIRRHASIKEKFRQHIQLRRLQFRMAFDHLIERGLMKEEWVPGLYDHLITNILILGDNWINHAEIHFDQKGPAVIDHYLKAFFSVIVPYLTESGLHEYRLLVKNMSYT
jgi:AcrR family transcriptional regulator